MPANNFMMPIKQISIQQVEGSAANPTREGTFYNLFDASLSLNHHDADHFKTNYQVTFIDGQVYEGTVNLSPDSGSNPAIWILNALHAFIFFSGDNIHTAQSSFDFLCSKFPEEARRIEKKVAEELKIFPTSPICDLN